MKFFLDNCVSPKLARALREFHRKDPVEGAAHHQEFEHEIAFLKEKYPQRTGDELWLPEVTAQGYIFVTTDRRIYKNEAQHRICRDARATGFFLAKGFEHLMKWEQAAKLFGYWPKILKAAAKISPGGDLWLVQLNGEMELGKNK